MPQIDITESNLQRTALIHMRISKHLCTFYPPQFSSSRVDLLRDLVGEKNKELVVFLKYTFSLAEAKTTRTFIVLYYMPDTCGMPSVMDNLRGLFIATAALSYLSQRGQLTIHNLVLLERERDAVS